MLSLLPDQTQNHSSKQENIQHHNEKEKYPSSIMILDILVIHLFI